MEDDYLEPDSLVDLRALEYVSTYDGHLMCPICHCPFIRPIRLKCDHIFCQKCLNSCITSSPSHIPYAPPSDNFACPTCRTPTMATFMKVPRLIISMCDDLCVKCPFVRQGCEEIIQRGHVQAHVDKYCDYRLMRCPDPNCNYMTRKKDMDADLRCLHEFRTCDNCEDSVMERDFEIHTKELCSSLKTECTYCHTRICRSELPEHLKTCHAVERTCCASKFGCPEKFKMEALKQHEQSCILAKLGPYLDAQASRMESMESTIKQLRQRNEILEDGIANIRSILGGHVSPLQPDPQTEVSPIIRSDSPLSLSFEHLDISSSEASNNPANDPTDGVSPPYQEIASSPSPSNTTTYLLSIHESLREEVTQLSNAISDIDARVNMSIMNEGIRLRDEMAHISAGVNAIRMQVHWLMNPRLHQSQRAVNASSTITPSAGDTSRNVGVATVGGSSDNPSSPPLPSYRGRRLSDGSREGTKL
ncbi:TRAF-type zinc finger protein [Histoplasma capsulatum var. duboisii H88]|uniref:TRAF-type zinc finger protein n=2 Tax=Ajellomyces capsulatus TaxID=5037 RepID=F0UNK9_AJEC8|nr:TRAF-type zinc finger protein [Histoplasma capsulatum H143]EGC47614.1 TRAF-type zinc finger protein [Histoplasma capsulatum var. duboisii H88]QSS53783.1 TRAF-type zinc finger protein [Histoplasma capsulatum var. duboisii H88]